MNQPVSPVQVFESIADHPCLGGRKFTIDLFADVFSTKVPNSFVTRYWVIEAPEGQIDAMSIPWAYDVQGGRHLGFLNPPASMLGQVLAKILRERADVVLVAPVWPRSWVALLKQLPIRAELMLPAGEPILHPGPLFPGGQGLGPRKPQYRMCAYFIIWELRQFGKGGLGGKRHRM